MAIGVYVDLDFTLLAAASERRFIRHLVAHGQLGPRALARMCATAVAMPATTFSARWKANKAYLAGMDSVAIETLAAHFVRTALVNRLSAAGCAQIARHRAAGHHVVLVTGSLELLARPLARALGIEQVLATALAQAGGRLTGALAGPHPYAEGKRLVMEHHAMRHGLDPAASYAYADSAADLPLLLAVGRPHAVNPSLRLRRVARQRGWPVLTW